MKIKINSNFIINTIIIGFALLLVANVVDIYYLSHFRKTFGAITGRDTMNAYNWENKLKPIEGDIPSNIELANQKFKELKDSIKLIRDLKNGNGFGDGVQCAILGTQTSTYCDTCSLKWYLHGNKTFNLYKKHYIKLFGWKINHAKNGRLFLDDSVIFHVEKGQAYIRKQVKFPKIHLFRTVDIPVKFYFSINSNCIMIPVEESTKRITEICLMFLGLAFIICSLYLIAVFLNFILDLAKGHAFTSKNIRRLKLIAFSLLCLHPCLFLINLLVRILFHSYFTSDVKLNSTMWKDSWETIGLGLVFLALYKSFKQGKKLKDEQDLTV